MESVKQIQSEKTELEGRLKDSLEKDVESERLIETLKGQVVQLQGDYSKQLEEVRGALLNREQELAQVQAALKESHLALADGRETSLRSAQEDTARWETKLAQVQEAMQEKEAEMLEHIGDLEEDLLATRQSVSELQQLILQRSRELLEKERELAAVVQGHRPAEELEASLAAAEDKRVSAELKAEDLREELEKVTKLNERTKRALSQVQEELAALRMRGDATAGGRSKPADVELERYKSALAEEQNHNVFLSRECARMEGEMTATLVAKEKTTAYLLYNLREVTSKMREYRKIVFLRVAGEGKEERDAMLAKLDNIDELRRQLFFTKAIAIKVDRATRGLATNLNVADLWARAEAMPFGEFDRFLGLELGKEK